MLCGVVALDNSQSDHCVAQDFSKQRLHDNIQLISPAVNLTDDSQVEGFLSWKIC